MTVSSTTSKVSFSGNGSTTAFAVSFYFLANSDLKVTLRKADGTEVVKTLTTDYTVTGAGNTAGGTVTMGTAPASGETLVITRNVSLTQPIDYQPNDLFPANTHEQALDRLTMITQQINETLARAIKVSTTNTIGPPELTVDAATRANKVLSFDASGELAVTQELGTYKGNWASGTIYAVRSIIKDTSNANIYICVTAHTSTGAQPISTNTDSAKWALIVDAAAAASSASAAASSASAASSSASAAATSASNASSSASSASTSASTATTQASNASSSASSASTSATNAASSATAAANSATAAAASAAAGLYRQVLDKNANYTVLAADQGTLFRIDTSGGARTITLPQISTVSDGFKVSVVKWTGDGNGVTIARSGSDTINGATSSAIGAQYTQITFVADFETSQWLAVSSGLGSTNVIVDVFSGNNSTTAFTLSGDPGSKNNTDIYISGVHQNHSTYTQSGTTITFSSAPPSGSSNIEIVWTQPLAIGVASDGTVTPAKLSTGGMSWDTSGNVGIGTSSPGYNLHVKNGGGNCFIAAQYGTGTIGLLTAGSNTVDLKAFNGTNDVLTFTTGASERMRIDSSGNVGIGTTPSAWNYGNTMLQMQRTQIFGDVNTGWLQTNSTYNSGFKYISNNFALQYYQDASLGKHIWQTAASGTAGNAITFTQAMTLDSSGNLLVGGTAYGAGNAGLSLAKPDGSGCFSVCAAGGSGYHWRFGNVTNGIVGSISTTTTTTTYSTSSDYRLKEDIAPMSGALAKVTALKPVTYKWKVDGSAGEGFIAHELAEVVPQCVIGEKDAMQSEQYQVGTQTVTKQRQVTDLRIEEREEIVLVDGKRVLRMVEHEIEVPLFEEVNVYNEDGSLATVTIPAVVDEDGNVVTPEMIVLRTMQVPVMQEYDEEEPVMGEREVPLYQGIDTSFLVATLTAAIQELKAEFDAYKALHP